MKEVGARLLVKTVEGLAAGIIAEKPQDEVVSDLNGGNGAVANVDGGEAGAALRHAPKIFTETTKID